MTEGRPGTAAVDEPAILRALESTVPSERDQAVRAAARYVEPQVLLRLVADPVGAVARNGAIAALERQGPFAVPGLERVLETSGDDDLVMFALQVLARIDSASAARPVLSLLSHSNSNVVQAAIEVLGAARDSVAVPALMALPRDDAWLQLAAVNALGAIGDARAVPWLADRVEDELLAVAAVEALARMPVDAAAERLADIAAATGEFAVRRAALLALGTMARRAPAEPALGRALQAVATAGSMHATAKALAALIGEACRDEARNAEHLLSAACVALAAPLPGLWPAALGALWNGGGLRAMPEILRPHRGRLARLAAECATHAEPAVRAAALALGLLDRSAAPLVAAALHDGDAQVRAEACRVAGLLALSDSASELVVRLRNGTREEQIAAVSALALMPPDLLVALGPCLTPDNDPPTLVRTLEVLEHAALGPQALAAFELVRHRSPAVRRAALRVIARLPEPKAEQVLLVALGDVHGTVQEEAIELLVARGGERMVDTFIGLLSLPNSLRFRVIRALGRLRVPRAAAKLEALASDCALHERLEIIPALVAIGPPSLRPFLTRDLGDGNLEIRRAAARGFASIAEPSDLPLLQRHAADPDWTIRNEMARALGRLPATLASPDLMTLARDMESVVARTARHVLARYRDGDVPVFDQ